MNDYRILVVDDEEDLCEILKFNLENEGNCRCFKRYYRLSVKPKHKS